MKRKAQDIVIACDMDDTIEYLLIAWISWLNREYNYNVRYCNVKDWNLQKSFPELTWEQIFAPLSMQKFWKTVKPMQDAIHYIKLLIDEGFDFHIVTSSYYDTIKYKFEEVLFKYFPFIDKNKIIVCHEKQLIRCDVLIDDGPHNIEGPYIGILKDVRHNHDYVCPDNVYRCHCWKMIYFKIHELFPDIEQKELISF